MPQTPNPPPDPPQYVAERIRSALAADRRVSELGLAVKIVGNRVHLGGAVATPDRRALVEEIVGRLLPDHEIQNDIRVQEVAGTEEPERLR
jgi:osmotically-inducible protein OsmY